MIASDEQLLGRLVKDHDLGLLFESGEVASLIQSLQTATAWDAEFMTRRTRALETFSARYSRAAYREALLTALTQPQTKSCGPAGTTSRGK